MNLSFCTYFIDFFIPISFLLFTCVLPFPLFYAEPLPTFLPHHSNFILSQTLPSPSFLPYLHGSFLSSFHSIQHFFLPNMSHLPFTTCTFLPVLFLALASPSPSFCLSLTPSLSPLWGDISLMPVSHLPSLCQLVDAPHIKTTHHRQS